MKNRTSAILAGDIGGTKTTLAVFSSEKGLDSPMTEKTFPSVDYPSLEALVSDFFTQTGMKVKGASFGVSGPVVEGRASITNLPWVMSEGQLREELGLSSVHLLNDLVAIAHALPSLKAADLHTLNQGDPAPGGAMAIVAPGTGLGEAYLTWDGSRYRAHASEGGHTDFAPNNPLEIDLLRYLQARCDHVSYERVCSGMGLPNIYSFLKDSGYGEEPAWLAEKLAQAEDPTPYIASAGLDAESPCGICSLALKTFVSILGAEAGNLGLKVVATGGVFLGGGIPPRILSAFEDGLFMETFRRKGRMSDLLGRMPVHVILNPKVALLGAACHGLDHVSDRSVSGT
jgi:glucokinase